MILALIFAVVLVLLVLRARSKRRRRPATGADVLAAATQSGLYPHHVVLPTSLDPIAGGRDVGF